MDSFTEPLALIMRKKYLVIYSRCPPASPFYGVNITTRNTDVMTASTCVMERREHTEEMQVMTLVHGSRRQLPRRESNGCDEILDTLRTVLRGGARRRRTCGSRGGNLALPRRTTDGGSAAPALLWRRAATWGASPTARDGLRLAHDSRS